MTVVTKAEFAAHLGVSKPAVSKMVKSGRIPVRADGKIDLESAVEAYNASKQLGRESSAKSGAAGGRPSRKGTTRKRSASPPLPDDLAADDDAPPPGSGGSSEYVRVQQQFARAKLAEKTYQAKLRQLEYEKSKGLVLTREEVEADAAATAEELRGHLMSVGPRVATLCEGRTAREIETIVEDAIHDALGAFQKSIYARDRASP